MLSENGNILSTCQKDVFLDYKEADVHNYQLLDILRGRRMNQFNGFRQLNTDKNSRIIIIVTSHGGENFIKIRGKLVILSDELHRTLNEMYIKERYKEIVFVLDTCEGFSLFDHVNVPNVYFVASALLNQKASSYSFDGNIMGPTSDKFHFLLWKKLNEISSTQNYTMNIDDLFYSIKNEKEFLTTDVTILNKIDRNLTVGEFFGNPTTEDSETVKYNKISLDFDENIVNGGLEFNEQLYSKKTKINKEVKEIFKFKQDTYILQEKETINTKSSSIFFIILGVVMAVKVTFSFII